ncbi:MAG: hypothetical protein ACXW01_04310 [Methylobacter sp.]
MTTETIEITGSTLITAEIVQLIAQLSPHNAALLLSGLSGGVMTPELAGLMARLRKEQIWAPLLKYFAAKNKHFIEELQWWISQQTEEDDDGMRM